jgi:hypothetical protein
MYGVSSEQHTAQAQQGEHLLGNQDLVVLNFGFGVRQHDRGVRGEGAQCPSHILLGQIVEAALQGLVTTDIWPGSADANRPRACWRKACSGTSRSSVGRDIILDRQ